ncbi:twitch domain-containing radical SAM protein [bacterium]|nr:twitch domain-containing radical SAM protein [bacterium]
MSAKNEFFCPMPFLAVDISSSGEVGYCCEAKPVDMAGNKVNPVAFLHGNAMADVREMFRNNAIPLSCQSCARSELKFGTSKRLREVERYLRQDYGPPLPTLPNSELIPQLRFLNYRVGNRCNLKCIMCNPQSSHLVALEETDSLGSTRSRLIENELHLTDSANDLRALYFGGGEPFLSDSFEKTLQYFSTKNPESIDVMLNTNLTVLPESALKLLTRFKSVYFGVSVDGFESSFEYIRFPHRWPLLKKNLEKLVRYTDFYVSFHVTLSCLNIDSVINLAKFLLSYPQINMRIEPLSEPSSQRVSNIKTSALVSYRKEIKKFLETQGEHLNKATRVSLQKCVSYLEIIESSNTEETSQELISFLTKKDKLRSSSFSTALPNLMTDLF